MECLDVCWLVLDQLPQLESSEKWEPGCSKKTDWASHEEQVCKEHSSMVSAPASRFLLGLASLSELRICKSDKPFPLRVAFGLSVLAQKNSNTN